MDYIYVLECAHNCYYVGKSKDPDKRLASHKAGTGAKWTQKHPPLKYAVSPRLADKEDSALDEKMETKRWMKRCGVEYVRGGPYCQVVIHPTTFRALTKELNHDNKSDEHYI